jgi:hypothetical protein
LGEFPKNNNVDQFYTFTVIIEGQRHFAQEIQVLEPLKSGKVNKTVKIPVIVKNTSDSIWQNAGAYPVNLAYHWLDANGKVIVFDGVAQGAVASQSHSFTKKLSCAKLP